MSAEPLLITRDDELAEEVTRLAAVAGRELRRDRDPGADWRSAPLILLDVAAATSVASAGHARRAGVVVVCTKPPPGFWRCAFEIGAEEAIRLPDDESRLVDLLAGDSDAAACPGRVLAITGGCGGAGASVLATATALAVARRGSRALLVDCDPLGGGLDLVLGAEKTPGLRWSGLTVSGGRVAVSALRDALPTHRIGPGAITVLACDRETESSGLTPEALRAVIDAGRRAGDIVVCDLPRSLTEVAVTALQRADLTVVVVPAEVRACAAAQRVVASLRDAAADVFAVVKGPAPGGLKVADVGAAAGLEVLTAMRPHPGLATAVDRGGLAAGRLATRGPLGRAAQDVLAVLDDLDSQSLSRAGAA